MFESERLFKEQNGSFGLLVVLAQILLGASSHQF